MPLLVHAKLETNIDGQTRGMGKSDQVELKTQFAASPIHAGELTNEIISGDDFHHGFLTLVLNNVEVNNSYFPVKPSMNYHTNANRDGTLLRADVGDENSIVLSWFPNPASPGNPIGDGGVHGPPNFDLANQPTPNAINLGATALDIIEGVTNSAQKSTESQSQSTLADLVLGSSTLPAS